MKKKVVIIGAGPAGLTFAYEILKNHKNDYEVEIIEKDKCFGGISRTIEYNGNKMDIGGHRFFTKDERVMKLWEELMPIQGKPSYDDKILNRDVNLKKGGPDPKTQDNVMLIRHRVSRIYYLKKFFDYPVTLKMQTIKNLGYMRTIKAGFSYLKTIVHKREEKSLEDFYINRFGKELYKTFFEDYTEKLWGRHPSEISADWGAQRVKGISIFAILKDMFNKCLGRKNSQNTETSLIEQFYYPKYGPGQLWSLLAKKVEELGAKIKLGFEVQKINFENGKIKSVICSNKKKNEEIVGDIFISSMPIKNLINSFNTKVPKKVKEIAEGLPYRDFITVGLLLKKLNLKNETNFKTLGNIIPDCWIYVQEPDVKMCRMQIFNNWSPYLVKKPDENIWIGLEYTCSDCKKFLNKNDDEFIEFAIDELKSMNIIESEDVIDTHIERIEKAYPAYFDTYNQIDEVIKYLNDIENLYCIGRNGQHRYNNMDHSMLTAMEAVNNITNGIKDKSNIWNVNTEKEYHETLEGGEKRQ